MNNNGRRPNQQGGNQPQYPQNRNTQPQRQSTSGYRPSQQMPQYTSRPNYPPVRHKSRRQARRAAGLVLLTVIILVMLLISVIIFAARCASGQIGADDTDPVGGSDSGNVSDDIGTTDPALSTTDPETTEPETTSLEALYQYLEKTEADIHKGYQILVNYQNPFTFDSGIKLQTFYGNRNSSYKIRDTLVSFDAHAMSCLNDMMVAFEADTGKHDILVNSSYRTYDEQEDLYAYRVDQYGEEYARLFVAVPGYSEHHTGLAADFAIYTDDNESTTFDKMPDYPTWLTSNGHKFGFIQRYPEDKTDITKIEYENWHYRYVGKPHAYYISTNSLCLEEYIDILRQFRYNGKHLEITDDEGVQWEVYFVPASPSGTTQVPVPKYQEYELSGNNVDGYIVTVKVL